MSIFFVVHSRDLSTITATAGQAEAGSNKASTKFCFEMASIELENIKKKTAKKEANSVVAAQYKVTPGQL